MQKSDILLSSDFIPADASLKQKKERMLQMKKMLAMVLAMLLCFGSVASADLIEGKFTTYLSKQMKATKSTWLSSEQERAFLTALLFLDLILLDDNNHLTFWDISDMMNDSYVSKSLSDNYISIVVDSNKCDDYTLCYDTVTGEAYYLLDHSVFNPVDFEEIVYSLGLDHEDEFYKNNPLTVCEIIYDFLEAKRSSN